MEKARRSIQYRHGTGSSDGTTIVGDHAKLTALTEGVRKHHLRTFDSVLRELGRTDGLTSSERNNSCYQETPYDHSFLRNHLKFLPRGPLTIIGHWHLQF